jgi:signal transduction histidine kinase/ligand-binding sensor domain-containing protein/DNA-binding response OmpR family regulator
VKIRFYIVVYSLFCGFLQLWGQPEAYFMHYGTENGLSQHTVTDILQDEKGFMWFSTWDGLSKFDGYTFTTYRLPAGNSIESRSSRIDNLYEDKYNNIWVLSYDNQAYRFNVETESFSALNSLETFKKNPFYVSQIATMESGIVWLASEKQGCISITDSLFSTNVYNTRNQNITDDFVHAIYEDKSQNSWILTNKGLTFVPAGTSTPVFYFHPQSSGRYKEIAPFYTAVELENSIWFGSNNGIIWKYDLKEGHFSELQTGTSSDIISIIELSSEKILILTKLNGFVIYNTHDGSMEVHNSMTNHDMKFRQIMTGYVDRSKNIWIETDEIGVAKYNPYSGQYKHFRPFVESTVTSVFPPNFFIFEDCNDRLWVHPRGGGFSLYDKGSDRLLPFYNEPFDPNRLFSNMMHSAFSDRQGNLWMCTRSNGLEKVIFYDESKFKSIPLHANVNSTISNEVRPIFEDSQHRTWVATKDGKIYVFDAEMKRMGIVNNHGEIGDGTPLEGIAYCVTEDSKHNIWIGTKGDGVVKLTPKVNERGFHIHRYKHNSNDRYSLSDNNVYSIFEDKNNNIWIGTFGGGLNLIVPESEEGRIVNHLNDLTQYPFNQAYQVRVITGDKHGHICVGTTLGFMMFSADFKSPGEIDFKIYTRSNPDKNSIGANDIIDICTTQSGDTYIGTFGGGISKIKETDKSGFPVSFETYNTVQGIPSNIILSIEEDQRGDLWISSEGGLTKFNRQAETFENFSEIKRMMKRHNFSENSSCCLRDGSMLFGYSHGMFVFDPENVKNNTFNPYLALVQFRLFNRILHISDEGPLYKSIDLIEYLQLKHNQNFFSIEFAALDYTDSENILYAYKLDGFDKEWIYSANQRIANYTNLSPGKYLFRVKSTNSDGVWTNNERTLAIELLPPFWATGWAYLIYAILAIQLLYFTFRILHTFYTMRNKIVLEKQESEIKTRFFTNISHEIRTPLTMIVSPIESLIQSASTPELVKKQLMLVSKNTKRLLNMVNQILDFQKMEQSPLTVSKIAIGPFVESIYENYIHNARLKSIVYSFDNKVGDQLIWIDPEAVEKIVVNLLSNAFKYTPPGKSVHVSVFSYKNDEVALQVKDTGIGISKDRMNRLFRRFESFNEDPSKPSTGIGLSIVKEMADKHNARIKVDSEEQVGSEFTVYFRKGTTHFGDDVTIDDSLSPLTVNELEEEVPLGQLSHVYEKEEVNDHPSVLVVEDDEDLRKFILSILENEYVVHEASNGREGLEKALELIPDFIISDIMMPEVNGIELLEKVRRNINTSHILFLLLTAKTTFDSKLEGFRQGADEYITKPFSVSYFKMRVKNLLQRRSELQHFYRNRTNSADVSVSRAKEKKETPYNEKDLTFIRTINEFIASHLGKSDYVIEDIAMELGMSRTVFFKKLKGLTGLAPIEYVRDVLMQHAAELLVQGDYAIKEISYMVGISDAKYFSRCFKKKFNMTPSEYKKQFLKDEML